MQHALPVDFNRVTTVKHNGKNHHFFAHEFCRNFSPHVKKNVPSPPLPTSHPGQLFCQINCFFYSIFCYINIFQYARKEQVELIINSSKDYVLICGNFLLLCLLLSKLTHLVITNLLAFRPLNNALYIQFLA